MILVCGELAIGLLARRDAGRNAAAPSDATEPVRGGSAFFDGGLRFEPTIAGGAARSAIALARRGVETGLFAGLSTDALGDVLFESLRDAGVDTQFLVRKPAPSGLRCTTLDARGGGPRRSVHAEAAADRALTLGDLPLSVASARAIHVDAGALAHAPTADALAALVAREHGRRAISLELDTAPDDPTELDRLRARIGALTARLDVVTVSEAALSGLYPSVRSEDVAAAWRGAGVGLVVASDAAGGARAWGGGGAATVAPSGAPLDDATFEAGLIAALDRVAALAPGAPGRIGPDTLRRALESALAGPLEPRTGRRPPTHARTRESA